MTEQAKEVARDRESAFFTDALEAVTSLAPQYSRVRLIGYGADEPFSRAGYRIDGADPDVTVARGGMTEFAAAREGDGTKLVLIPTGAHTLACAGRCFFPDGSFLSAKQCTPADAVVFEKTQKLDRAALLGEIVALDLCAAEQVFAARMRGTCPDTDAAAEAGELVTELTEALDGKEKLPCAVDILLDFAMRAARLVARSPALALGSGAAQAGRALSMLFAREGRELPPAGTVQMLLAYPIVDFYLKNLGDIGLHFPPNNARRIDCLCEYLGADLFRACVHVSPLYSPKKLMLCEYRHSEFRAETARSLAAVRDRLKRARTVFMRSQEDDGFSLTGLVDGPDLALCLALGPDVLAADTVLSFLKQTGRLDDLLV